MASWWVPWPVGGFHGHLVGSMQVSKLSFKQPNQSKPSSLPGDFSADGRTGGGLAMIGGHGVIGWDHSFGLLQKYEG